MRTYAIVLAAGSGTRFGADKVDFVIRGKPLWRFSFDALVACDGIDGVGLVCGEGKCETCLAQAPGAAFVVEGGASRVDSCRKGLGALPEDAEIVLIHDAARPIIDERVVARVIKESKANGGAAPAIEAVDTIREISENSVPILRNRRNIRLMQTPQGAQVELLRQALAEPDSEKATDEMSLLEQAGHHPVIVDGNPDSFKITLPADLARFAALLDPPESRTGIGYDIHARSAEPGRKLWLGGILFEGEQGLEGHSDADVLLHAVVDALLGAAGLGDIGVHFPNSDPEWKNAPSTKFLEFAAKLLGEHGWKIRNIDATLIAENPKVMPRAHEIRAKIASILGIEDSRVSLKATTNEGLGAIGRDEGIAAFSVATITQYP